MHNPQESIIKDVLTGKAKPEDIRMVIAWFSTDEGQRYLSEYINKEYEQQGLPLTSHISEVVCGERMKRSHTQTSFNSSRMWLKIAAVMIPILLLMGGGLLVNRYVDLFGNAKVLTINVPQGQQRVTTLPDGSFVYLGPGSRLSYPECFSLFKRDIKFSGEAYFQVTHHKYRPFNIQTGDVTVHVLGTSFNLMADSFSSKISLRLDKGLVRLKDVSGEECLVRSGDNIVYDKKTRKYKAIPVSDLSVYLDWRRGIMQFNDAPLNEVLQVLSSKYNVRFQVKYARLNAFRYTIIWENTSLEKVLREMSMITPIHFSQSNFNKDFIIVY